MERGDHVLVTGATGFVGAAVARALVKRGAMIRALIRPRSSRRNLAHADFETVEGDLNDPESVRRAMVGVRFVFHVAADYRLWARDPGQIVRTNVEGTRAVMEAALAAGVERVCHTSSVATLRVGDAGSVGDEAAPLAPGEAIGAYKTSKLAAERLVEAMARERGLPAVIVNPSTPIGPGDVKPTPTGRIIVEAARGRMPAFVDTGLNLAHVDDVASGHLLALEKGEIGERYILGGQNAPLREMLAVIAELTGRRAPTLGLPRAPLWPIAVLAEAAAFLTGHEPFVSRDALKMAAHHMYFSSAKAEAALGYSARPYREGLVDALDWFRAEGMVP